MYRTVDCSTWDDPWFSDLEPLQKLLFLYLVTNRRTTSCGAFEITVKAISFETGLPAHDVDAMLQSLAPQIVWWPGHKTVWVRNFYKHQKCNENFKSSAIRHTSETPELVRAEILKQYPELTGKENTVPPSKTTVPQRFPNGSEPIPNGSATVPQPTPNGRLSELDRTNQNRTNQSRAEDKTPASPEKSAREKTKPTARQKPPVDEFPPDDVPIKSLDDDGPPQDDPRTQAELRTIALQRIAQARARDAPASFQPLGESIAALSDGMTAKGGRHAPH